MSIKKEFETVNILIESSTTTGRTDAFIISWVKLEKQVRKIFSYLIYQFPCFSSSDVSNIVKVFSSKRYLYFYSFIQGFNEIYSTSFENIIGEEYQFYKRQHNRMNNYRNKILHGQLTAQYLTSNQLRKEVQIIYNWCDLVATKFQNEIGFDGFLRNSFRKAKDLENILANYKINLKNLDILDAFIEQNMRLSQ